MTTSFEEDSGDRYLDVLEAIALEDAAGLKKAQASYGNSWKSRGGVGAFMMLARKWDRLENQLKRRVDTVINFSRANADNVQGAAPYDIFAHVIVDQRAEGVLDDIRDLRRYLMLVEAELRARGVVAVHRDNQPEPIAVGPLPEKKRPKKRWPVHPTDYIKPGDY